MCASLNTAAYRTAEPVPYSERTKGEKLVLKPGLSANITQEINEGVCVYISDDRIINHNIAVERLSISPLGNIIVLTEAGLGKDINTLLFYDFIITDDKGNIYKKNNFRVRPDPGEDMTYAVEFIGCVPPDTEYIKIVPFNKRQSLTGSRTVYNYADVDNLPARVKYSDYGDIIIESAVLGDENVTVTYRTEGIVDEVWLNLDCRGFREKFGYSSERIGYNRDTGLTTGYFKFNNTENAHIVVKGIGTAQYDIEFLEDQAIVIPLK